MIKGERPQIILVCGVTGAGKSTFVSCYKNSFLQSLPLLTLSDGLNQGVSFSCETNLTNQSQFTLLEKAKLSGYKVTAYYVFSGKALSMARARLREITKGIPFDEALFKRTYESSYKGLMDLYDLADLVFIIRNQESFEFLSAYENTTTPKIVFQKIVKQVKSGVDRLK
jgi:predicted ABC-type ATPase